MDPGQPEQKRPRLDTPNNSHSWTALPHPTPSQHPPPQGPGPYQHQHQPYTPRAPDHPPHPHTLPPPPPPPPQQQQQQQPAGYPNDRRHHEQEPYAPMQDHYRQPPSPARPHNYAFLSRDPRDSGIKREMIYDEPASQQPRRPHSTGGAPGGPPPQDTLPPPNQSHSAPGPPHGPPHGPPPHYPDDSRRHGYDGPQSLPPTPGSYRNSFPAPPGPQPPPPIQQQPPPPPPPQQQQQSPYDSHPYQPPSVQDQVYSQVAYAASQKRKATRASQACDYCRQLKAKCDETKPCKTCREKGVECKYREPITKPTDKSQADVLDGIAELKSMIESVQTNFKKFEERVGTLERGGTTVVRSVKVENDMETPARGASPTPIAESAYAFPDQVTINSHSTPQFPMQHDTPQTVYTPAEGGRVPPEGPEDQHPEPPVDEDDEDELTEPPGPSVRPGQPSIPDHHTLSAGLLLTWPSINRLTHHILKRENVFPLDFPQRIEEKRGLLRLYGRGEGHGHGRGESAATDHGHLDVDGDTYSEPGSSPAGQADWGQLGSMSPVTSADYKSATLTEHGQPDFAEHLVWKYIDSFQANVLNLHPIIYKKHLTRATRKLLQQTAPRASSKPSLPVTKAATFTAQANDVTIGKRKRSPTNESIDKPVPGTKPGAPSRSIETAIVLAALALGKLSLNRDKISDVTPSEPRSHNSPVVRNGHPASPAQTSPPQQSQSSGFVSPREASTGSASRRPSWQASGPGVPPKPAMSMKRNYDSVPGLEYLGPATDIVGNQDGGVTIQHVQANILIALYYGQIGYVVQSLKYISNASWTLQVYMRRDLPRIQARSEYISRSKYIDSNTATANGLKEKAKDHLLLMTFWTCLQLESDIVVELNLPRSGILSYEEGTPYPNGGGFIDCEDHVIKSYLAQLYIRKRLNEISTAFYSDDPTSGANGIERKVSINEVREMIRMDPDAHISWLPTEYRFVETDPPATDILSARLRAKYWGFQVICLRPFIKMILDFSIQLEEGSLTEAAVVPETNFNLNKVEAPYIEAGTKKYEDINPEVVRFAQEGINALQESTRAFHNLDHHRLLLTNFFGTAIAQWGNLLVLAACFRDPFLGKFVDHARLRSLFERTISWISKAAQPSSSLALAVRMLVELRDNNFAPPETSVNRSFSSSTTSGAPNFMQHSPVQSMPVALPPGQPVHPMAHPSHPHAHM